MLINEQMNFAQALENLMNGKLMTRGLWSNKILKSRNNKIEELSNSKGISSAFVHEEWEPQQQDILANDWRIVDQEDLKEFVLSANELKELGLSQESIDNLREKKKQEFTNASTSQKMDKDRELLSQDKMKELMNRVGYSEEKSPLQRFVKNCIRK